MSYYKITVKDNGKDVDGNIQSSIKVFKYKDKVRDKLHEGAYTSFNDMLVEIVCRIMTPEEFVGKPPIHYYEFIMQDLGLLSARIEKGILELVDHFAKQEDKTAGAEYEQS